MPLTVVIASILIVAACGGDDQEGAKTQPGPAGRATLIFADIAEPDNVDPHVNFNTHGFNVTRNVYDRLLDYERGTTKLVPELAKAWDVSSDGTVYTFTLRDGVKFHDGSSFDAGAVQFNIDRIKKINQGPATLLTSVKTVNVRDSRTVEFVLSEPYAFFPAVLPKIELVSPKAVTEHEVDGDLARDWFATHAVGTGPYKLDEEWIPGSGKLTLTKNADYWRGWPAGTFEKIQFTPTSELSTRLLKLQRGELDFVTFVPTTEAERLATVDGVKVLRFPTFIVLHIPLNHAKGPLSDRLVRRALLAAFDYEAVARFYGKLDRQSLAKVPSGPLASGFEPATDGLSRFQRDLGAARELLAQSGFRDGGKLRYCAIQGIPEEEFVGTVMQQSFGPLGFDVKVDVMPWAQAVALESKVKSSCDMSALLMGPFGADPTVVLAQNFHSDNAGGFVNWSYLTDERVDELLETARLTADPEKQQEFLDELQQRLLDDGASLYASEPDAIYAMRADINGYVYDPLDFTNVVKFWYLTRGSNR
jgi:peptide/nickel transport system substrate-binding protein